MALARSFKEAIQDRITGDKPFRRAPLTEAVQMFLQDDVTGGKSVLRDYFNATIGFRGCPIIP